MLKHHHRLIVWLGLLAVLCGSCAEAGATSTTYRQCKQPSWLKGENATTLRRAYTESCSVRTFRCIQHQSLYITQSKDDADMFQIRTLEWHDVLPDCAGSSRSLQTRWLARLSAQCTGSACRAVPRSPFNDADNRRALAQAPLNAMPCPPLVADGIPDQCYSPNLGNWYHDQLPTCVPDVAVKCCVEAFSEEQPQSPICSTCNFVKARVEVACAAMYRPMECILPCDPGI